MSAPLTRAERITLRSMVLGATRPLDATDRATLDSLERRGLVARSGESYRLLPAGHRLIVPAPAFLERAS